MEDGDFRRRPPLWTSYFSPEEVCFLTTVHTLASGSSGNALLLSCGESYILLDAGISCRRITAALRELGLELGSLTAILITHTHADHISGLQTLLFLAALQTVPASMYEAARIEGGTAWENFWKITFPMVSPTILINVVYSIVDSFNDYSNEIVKYINSFATRAYFEYSSAMAWVYTVISLLFVGIFYFIVNKFVYYEV